MSRDIGIDLGTANVLIHMKGQGIIFNEPAVVAIDNDYHEIIAYGHEASEVVGRSSGTVNAIYPLQRGVIADYELAEGMLILMLNKIYKPSWLIRPNVLVCTPSSVNDIEKQALVEVVKQATQGKIYIEEETKVAALGAGIDIQSPIGHMIIDIGGGTTDIGIIASGDLVHKSSLPIAGDNFTQAIIQNIRNRHKVLIGKRTAQAAKHAIASAVEKPQDEVIYFDIQGRNLLNGLPKSVNINSNEIQAAIYPELIKIVHEIQRIMDQAKPELLADITQNGIILTGGSALIHSLDTFLASFLGVSVITAEQPMHSVAIGTGLMIDMIQTGKLKRYDPTVTQRIQRQIRKYRRLLLR